MRAKAKDHLAAILAAIEKAEIGRDVSTSEWIEILEEVRGDVSMRLEAVRRSSEL